MVKMTDYKIAEALIDPYRLRKLLKVLHISYISYTLPSRSSYIAYPQRSARLQAGMALEAGHAPQPPAVCDSGPETFPG